MSACPQTVTGKSADLEPSGLCAERRRFKERNYLVAEGRLNVTSLFQLQLQLSRSNDLQTRPRHRQRLTEINESTRLTHK
jgi:hypothetical protein